MLTAHPKVSISAEGYYIFHLRSKLSTYGELSEARNVRTLHRNILPFLKLEKFLAPPTWKQLLEWVELFGADIRSLITFYGTWEARILGKTDLLWWGDNAPYHIHHLPFFDSLFPQCRVILMIRDPRDSCASVRTSFPLCEINDAIAQWGKAVLDGLHAKEYLGPERLKLIKYEDLVSAPRESLGGICNFLGIEYTEDMLNYCDSDIARSISQLNHHQNLKKPVFISSIGKHRELLTRREIDEIEEDLCTSMRYLNYLSYEEYDHASRRRFKKRYG